MPGHKRNTTFLPAGLTGYDMTEIPGMDILHAPTGIIKDLQHKIADFYGADESFILVNGSTAGIAAAICAVCSDGSKLYAARNGHVSMHSGIALSGALPEYITPEMAGLTNVISLANVIGLTNVIGLAGGINPKTLDNMQDNSAAFIVSPTYEGFVSDVKSIADKVHSHNSILIVDEAHGAHFPFHSTFPDSALMLGADIVIQSFHKTLPVLGQLAVLHVKSPRVDTGRLRYYLQAMQTTSPSYMLMAQLDYALEMLWKRPILFDMYTNRLNSLRNALTSDEILPLELVGPGLIGHMGIHDIDRSKLLFNINVNQSAQDIYETLATEYGIQLEMANSRHLLAMTSVADTDEGMQKLWAAMGTLNVKLRADSNMYHGKGKQPNQSSRDRVLSQDYDTPKMVMPPRQAVQHATEIIPWEDAAGRIASEVIATYPPGIALIAPGERIPEGLPMLASHIRVVR